LLKAEPDHEPEHEQQAEQVEQADKQLLLQQASVPPQLPQLQHQFAAASHDLSVQPLHPLAPAAPVSGHADNVGHVQDNPPLPAYGFIVGRKNKIGASTSANSAMESSPREPSGSPEDSSQEELFLPRAAPTLCPQGINNPYPMPEPAPEANLGGPEHVPCPSRLWRGAFSLPAPPPPPPKAGSNDVFLRHPGWPQPQQPQTTGVGFEAPVADFIPQHIMPCETPAADFGQPRPSFSDTSTMSNELPLPRVIASPVPIFEALQFLSPEPFTGVVSTSVSRASSTVGSSRKNKIGIQ